jgi:hypothetical protein
MFIFYHIYADPEQIDFQHAFYNNSLSSQTVNFAVVILFLLLLRKQPR